MIADQRTGNAGEDHVAKFLGSDPVAGNEALEYFCSRGPECLNLFVPLDADAPANTQQSGLRFAKLCRRLGDDSIPILCEALKKGRWSAKMLAARGFDLYPPGAGGNDAGRVAELMADSNVDTARAAILAMGYMGAYGWAGNLTSKDVASPARGRYLGEKLGSFALESLLMMIARMRDVREADFAYVFGCVEQQYEGMEEHLGTSDAATLKVGCLRFGPSAADAIIQRWIRNQRPLYREMCLWSLATIGLRRTATAVAEQLMNFSEQEDLRAFAARCLGDIGGPVAVETLERWLTRPGTAPSIRKGILWGLASVLPEATRSLEPRTIDEILRDNGQASLHLIHSLGFRREGEDHVRRYLHDSDPMMRGTAALSMARIQGAKALDTLRVAYREGTNQFERALMLCALILLGERSRVEELSSILDDGYRSLSRRWKDEFVCALAAGPDPRFAEAWSEVLGVDLDPSRERLGAWGGAYPLSGSHAKTGPTAAPAARDLIFISYSHEDEELCLEFLKMVRPTAQKHGLKIWSDHEIPVGAIWRDEIEKALARTRIAVLLVSTDFLDSSFVQNNELPPLLKAADAEGARIFWIACRPCNVEDTEIGKFQGANKPSKPLAALKKVQREKELQRISQMLFEVSRSVGEGG